MLTVKLKNTTSGVTTIVETPAVQVLPRNGGGKTVMCDHVDSAGRDEYIVHPGGEYNVAYIENSQAVTIETVR